MAKNLKLKAARAVRDMTQADLAAAVGVSRQTINGRAVLGGMSDEHKRIF